MQRRIVPWPPPSALSWAPLANASNSLSAVPYRYLTRTPTHTHSTAYKGGGSAILDLQPPPKLCPFRCLNQLLTCPSLHVIQTDPSSAEDPPCCCPTDGFLSVGECLGCHRLNPVRKRSQYLHQSGRQSQTFCGPWILERGRMDRGWAVKHEMD